jgi:hypothetical protein
MAHSFRCARLVTFDANRPIPDPKFGFVAAYGATWHVLIMTLVVLVDYQVNTWVRESSETPLG